MDVAHKPSFSEVYASHFRTVVRAAFAVCGDREMSEDAAQEAFARAWIRWRRLQGQSWIVGWLAKTAMHIATRDLARTRRLGLLRSVPASIQEPADDQIVAAQLLAEHLMSLPPRQREAVVLHYVTDLPIEEVARNMSCAVGTVKAHLAKARPKLRTFVRGQFNA